MCFKRFSALMIVLALMLVPAVGRARQHVDPPNAKPRLSAPYRSVDVRPSPILVAPDTSAVVVRAERNEKDPRHLLNASSSSTLPAAPDVRRGTLRGPPA